MTLHRLPALPLAAALLMALSSAWLVPAHAAGAAAEQTEIYQQRGADGGVVLTDRPSPSRSTERVWQIEREDPAAASQRAEGVRREARAVSERVQRRLDNERERAAEVDFERRRFDGAVRDRQVELARIEAENDASPFLYSPFGYSSGSRLDAPYASPRLGQRRFDQRRFGQHPFDERRLDERQTEGGRFDGRIGTRPRFYSQPNPAFDQPRPPRKHPHAAPRQTNRLSRPADEAQ